MSSYDRATLIQGQYIASPPSLSDGFRQFLLLDANGNIKVTLTGSSGAGSTGQDVSGSNKPTIPNVGAAFAGSGPYASYVLITTVAASSSRVSIDVENNSGAQIVIVRDDGTAATSAPPANASVFPIGGGSGVGSQGGSWISTTFKGRVQIYAPSSAAQVSVMVD